MVVAVNVTNVCLATFFLLKFLKKYKLSDEELEGVELLGDDGLFHKSQRGIFSLEDQNLQITFRFFLPPTNISV